MRTDILKMKVDILDYKGASDSIYHLVKTNTGSYVCVANVHMCMETFDSEVFCSIVNSADLVVPDGRPLVWVQKIKGARHPKQVRGSDLLLKVCERAEKENISIGLYGGTEKSLTDLQRFLKEKFPDIKITFAVSPPFRELTRKEDNAYTAMLNSSDVKILFVGIGCPKQEKWMAAHKDKLNCVMIGVGAAFDFLSGQKKHAPRWMQHSGLEWIFRLFSDPKRLYKRYLKHNPRFIYYLFLQFIKQINTYK